MKCVRLRLAILALSGAAVCLACLLAATPLPAQTPGQQLSLGEVARRVREQKKIGPKATHIWTNDNLPTTPSAVSVVGPASAPPAPGEAERKGEEAGAAAPAAEPSEKELSLEDTQAALAAAKEKLAQAEKEVDLLRRDSDLQRQQFYSNPGYASDTAGKARLDALRDQIEAKQQEVEQAKEKVAALEEVKKLKSGSTSPKEEAPPET